MLRLLDQAECDELACRAEALKEENVSLRAEVSRVRIEYEKLLEENTSLKVQSDACCCVWRLTCERLPRCCMCSHF